MCGIVGLPQFLHIIEEAAKFIAALLVLFLALLCLRFGSPAIGLK